MGPFEVRKGYSPKSKDLASHSLLQRETRQCKNVKKNWLQTCTGGGKYFPWSQVMMKNTRCDSIAKSTGTERNRLILSSIFLISGWFSATTTAAQLEIAVAIRSLIGGQLMTS